MTRPRIEASQAVSGVSALGFPAPGRELEPARKPYQTWKNMEKFLVFKLRNGQEKSPDFIPGLLPVELRGNSAGEPLVKITLSVDGIAEFHAHRFADNPETLLRFALN